MNDEFLLQCVTNYRPLWDKTYAGYKSLLQKENCWRMVAASLNTSVDAVKIRFKALREKYRRELKTEERYRRSGAPANARPVWPLKSFFQFMNPQEERETVSNCDNQETGDSWETQVTYDNVDTEEVVAETSHSNTLETFPMVDLDHDYAECSGDNRTPQIVDAVSEISLQTPRKRLKTGVEINDIDDAIRDIRTVLSRPLAQVSKYDQFATYLAAELKELPLRLAEQLMDDISLKVIEAKHTARNQSNGNVSINN